MTKVIETNISHDDEGNFKDHQSRVIEVESWELLKDEINRRESVDRKSAIGTMMGRTLPINCKVPDIEWDEKHGSCMVISLKGNVTKKLFYRIA